ncbi:MAG: hypothetical protein J3R72DRAFT_495533 [Linnemannia gamsii]|nr:MAG: hypothetical protein J3R72DRAFT_495533 [Linnemannia gamsii]
MTNITDLPLECLQNILQFLMDEDRMSDLTALLCVNKLLASVALPHLYTDPFRPSFRTKNIYSNAGFKLTRLLLDRLYVSSPEMGPLNQLLQVVYGVSNDASIMDKSKERSPLGYPSYIRHLTPHPWHVGPYKHRWRVPPEAQSYVQGQEFESQCPMDLWSPSFFEKCPTREDFLRQVFPFVLVREVCWALTSPILEQLQSLVVPVSCIERYLAVVSRLESLQRVRFLMDETYGFHPNKCFEDFVSPQYGTAIRAREVKVSQGIVRFVQDHAQFFKDQLTDVSYVHDGGVGTGRYDFYYKDAQQEILRLLPPLHRPVVISEDNMIHLAAHPFSTNMAHVKRISITKPDVEGFRTLLENPEILQRCRSLKKLHTYSLGPDSFKWAVREKEIMNGLGGGGIGNVGIRGQRGREGLLTLGTYEGGLVPLEDVSIEMPLEPYITEVNDIAFAFNQTLKRLVVNLGHSTQDTNIELLIHTLSLGFQGRGIRFGRAWVDLPVLTRLVLDLWVFRLEIDPQLLAHCPNLDYLELSDETYEYRYQDVIPCPPAHLAHLGELHLRGWGALTFDPATLYSTTQLTHLKLMTSFRSTQVFLPPVEDLIRVYGLQDDDSLEERTSVANDGWNFEQSGVLPRPRWTWDWYLPNLRRLHLTSEFAYRFQFRMLQSCPALYRMDLDMRGTDEQHARLLTRSDLFALRRDNGLDQQQQQRIVAPSLYALRMRGRWIMDDALFDEFLTYMFPCLIVFKEDQWSGLTLGGVVRALRSMATRPINSNKNNKNAEIVLSLPEPSDDQLLELGLSSKHSVVSSYRPILPLTLHLASTQFSLFAEL